MIVKEYGKSNEDIIMLLHGGGLSCGIMKKCQKY